MEKTKPAYWDDYYRGSNQIAVDKYDGWLDKYPAFLLGCDNVLDLGCGSGTNIEAILGKCQKVCAADFSISAIELVKKKYAEASVSTYCFDMREIFPFSDHTFDAVIADLSLHYFDMIETQGIFSEIKRTLKCSGKLIARVHSINSLKPGLISMEEPGLYLVDGYPRKYFTITEIAQLLAEWNTHVLKEDTIYRYKQIKEIIEFVASPKSIT